MPHSIAATPPLTERPPPAQGGPAFSGVVLAGGHSSRMGRAKHLLTLGREVWWQRQARLLHACGASSVALSLRPGQKGPEGIVCIQDLHTDSGPLAGLQAALARCPSPLCAVLAVDMPLLGADWFDALLPFCSSARGAAFLREGFPEPLAALYPRCALPVLELQIQNGRLSPSALCRLLAAQGLLHLREIPRRLQAQSLSLNTPESLVALRH